MIAFILVLDPFLSAAGRHRIHVDATSLHHCSRFAPPATNPTHPRLVGRSSSLRPYQHVCSHGSTYTRRGGCKSTPDCTGPSGSYFAGQTALQTVTIAAGVGPRDSLRSRPFLFRRCLIEPRFEIELAVCREARHVESRQKASSKRPRDDTVAAGKR